MSEQIKRGDLVMIVRGHSCALELLGGVPWTVEGFSEQVGGGWRCNRCGARDVAPEATLGATGVPVVNVPLLKGNGRQRGVMPVPWLKRIPPLEELERDKLVEKLRELI